MFDSHRIDRSIVAGLTNVFFCIGSHNGTATIDNANSRTS